MSCFTEEQLSKISNLVKEIEKLSDIEKLLLYLQLPCGRAELIEGKYKVNGKHSSDIFSKKPDLETTQTYTWILSHLEEDPNVSLPKQEVYDEYRAFCQANRFEPLCVADFGKAMKHAFPCIKPRRLGQRGNSRYCYSGLRKKYKIQPPSLPDMIELPTTTTTTTASSFCSENSCSQQHHHHQQQQQSFNQNCRQPSALDNLSPDGPLNANDIHHHHHAHRQPNFSGYKAMNLKIESNSHEQNHHSTIQQCDVNGTYNSLSHPQDNKLSNSTAPDRQETNQVAVTGDTQQIEQVGGSHGVSTNSLNGMNQQQQIVLAEYAPTPVTNSASHMHRPTYEYPGIVQRFGTPDDDDYRHNYQDLNRPIVSEVIPFSQTRQEPTNCGLTPYGHPPANQASQHQPIQNHLSSPTKQPVAQQHHPPRLQLDINQQATSSCTNSHTMTSTTMTNTTTNQHHQLLNIDTTNAHVTSEHNHLNNQNHHHFQPTTNNNNDVAHHSHPLHIHLSNTTSCNHHNVNNSSIDYCASPFQSPASTPYPMMGNFLMQDVQDYYSNDCIRYPDQ